MAALRFASHHDHPLGQETQSLRQVQRARWLSQMGIEACIILDPGLHGPKREAIQGSGWLTASHCIDDYNLLKPFQQPHNKMHPANAHIEDFYLWGERTGRQAADHFDAKAVIAKQRIAETGDQGFAWHTQRSVEV